MTSATRTTQGAVNKRRVGGLTRQPVYPDAPDRSRAWQVAASVPDPELAVLTIGELGILRDVTVDDQGRVHVQVTPIYSGCPAMETIRTDLIAELTRSGYLCVCVEFVLSPAWTTDWMTETARAKLTAYGISPPGRAATSPATTSMPWRSATVSS